MGNSVKRRQDPRSIRGQGHYVPDIQLPDILYLDIVRSPYAHARIKSINTERALKVPGVLAVITGETLAQYNLHWMPTLMSDTQMVLPTEKVMYQAQEVAGVIATDPKTGVGLAVRPSFRDPQGPPETLVVGSYYPSGTFRRFSDQTRREMEAAAGSDLGSSYSVEVAFSSTPSPAPGFDVVEVIITRARR